MTITIAIAGISSTLAILITKSLLHRPDVHIRGSSRDINKIPDDLKSDSRISLVQSGPYDTETLRNLVRGCDVVICCYFASSEVMIEGQKLLIDLCEKEGEPRYIASDYTIDFRKLDRADLEFKNFTKDVAEYLNTKAAVRAVHILVGMFTESFLDVLGVWNPEVKEVRYWGTGNEEWDLTSYHTTAEYVAAVAADPTASGYFKFLGDHKSTVEIASDIETVSGSKPVLRCNGPLTDIENQLDGKGNLENMFTASQYFILTGKVALGDDTDNAKYPSVKPETFFEVFRRHSKEDRQKTSSIPQSTRVVQS